MKYRRQSGQMLGGAGEMAVFLPIFGIMFALLYSVAVMVIYQQRLTFLATWSAWAVTPSGWGSNNPGMVPGVVSTLGLPNNTTVVVGGPINCNGANVFTATATCPFQILGPFPLTYILSDTEGMIQVQY